jgi:hypothetical protein
MDLGSGCIKLHQFPVNQTPGEYDDIGMLQ